MKNVLKILTFIMTGIFVLLGYIIYSFCFIIFYCETNNLEFCVQDGYPSIMDIELAIERMMVIDYIKLRPELLVAYSTTSKMCHIQGFQTTPYVVDYGVVITGSTVSQR